MTDRESARLAALARYEILDTPTEAAFDEIASLAARICEAPIAVVNLVGDGRQFFKAEVGLGVRETPLETSFCNKALLEDEFLLIPNAAIDPRFERNPLVTADAGLRFYAGALLKTVDGLPIGTLCVLDTRARGLTDLQQDALRILARQVMTQLDLRLALRIHRETEARHVAIVESATDYAMIATDLGGLVTEWNTGAELIFGWTQAEMLGQSAERIFTPEDRAAGVAQAEMLTAVVRERGIDERWHLRRSGERFWASGEMMPLRRDGDQLVGYIKILRDRTEEKLRIDQLKASEQRLRSSQQAGGIGSFEIDIAADTMSVTPEFCAIFGVPEAPAYRPAVFEACVLPEDRHVVSDAVSRDAARADTDVEYRICRASDGQRRWIARRAQFAGGENGQPARMFGTVQDITDRRRAAAFVTALLTLGDRLRDASGTALAVAVAAEILGETLGAARAGFARIDLATRQFTVECDWNAPGVDAIAGAYSTGLFAATITRLQDGTTLAVPDIAAAAELAADAEAYRRMNSRAQIEVPLIDRGRLVAALFVHSIEPRAWTAAELDFARGVADRTYAAVARLDAEHEQQLLNQELSHRLKNTLAMVQAIASQTLKDVGDRDAVDALTARIVALSTAHDILLEQHWSSADLEAVARGVLNLHAAPEQIAISGPAFELSPRAGLSVSLLLNELATNAAKYGAFSAPGGRVTLAWEFSGEFSGEFAGELAGELAGDPRALGDKPVLALRWSEAGGPPVIEPARKGFGTRLIRMGLVGTGQSRLDYAATGLQAAFTAPVALLQQD